VRRRRFLVAAGAFAALPGIRAAAREPRARAGYPEVTNG
jgi:hypothetical protein